MGVLKWCRRNFLDKIIRLLILGLSLYCAGLLYQAISHDNVIKHQVKCRYCKKRISTKVSGVGLFFWRMVTDVVQAKRCFQCTRCDVWLLRLGFSINMQQLAGWARRMSKTCSKTRSCHNSASVFLQDANSERYDLRPSLCSNLMLMKMTPRAKCRANAAWIP